MKPTRTFTKYGTDWSAETSHLAIEFYAIKHEGFWKNKKGESCGLGLVAHYNAAAALLWPDLDCHRWHELMMQHFVVDEITVLLGCSDSSKTFSMSAFVLIDYWAYPDDTLWLVSSTDFKGAELRIWGKIKELFTKARKRFPELPGCAIEYLHAITTADIREDKADARSLQRGIIVVPCFPSGTMVDTPNGKVAIEKLSVGDEVFHAAGVGKIKEVHSRIAKTLVRVHLSDGRQIDCTDEHPFFTDKGWIKAIDLHHCDVVYSSHETMRLLWSQLHTTPEGRQQNLLLSELSGLCQRTKLRLLQPLVQAAEIKKGKGKSNWKVLLNNLCRAMGSGKQKPCANSNKEVSRVRGEHEARSLQPSFLLGKMQESTKSFTLRTMWEKLHLNASCPRKAKESFLRSVLQEELERSVVRSAEDYSNARGNDDMEDVPGFNPSAPHQDGNPKDQQCSKVVSDRRSISRDQTGSGDRWRGASHSCEHGERQDQDEISGSAWVDRVEILESRSDKRFDESKEGYTVHNIEVEGHPSYSVNGVVVHNCKKGNTFVGLSSFVGVKAPRLRHAGDEVSLMSTGFLDAYSNWYGKDNFKGIMAGNPLDQTDPLCVAAEPINGWDNYEDTGKTETWKSAFFNATVIALDGRDSPNFDFPLVNGKVKYPYLIGAKKLNAVEKTHGKESWQYYNQCIGKPVRGLTSWRVITRELCRQHHARDDAIWDSTARTRLYSLDPSYGGGDPCIGTFLEFGRDAKGKDILSVGPPETIPISVKSNVSPEDQVATFTKNRLQTLNVKPGNCFYDATGKGTLGFAFAKVFGADSPIAVDSGGSPTSRPVRHDLFVDDDRGSKRLKRCDEHYSKFVTEMWFSVRNVILCEQLRGLGDAVINEGAKRLYKVVKGNREELEPKDDYKERVGESPNNFDSLAIGVEGARQRGFKIHRLGPTQSEEEPDTWAEEAHQQYHEALTRNLLTHA